jgi:ABC-type phosphate transport system substrate-binding protein
VVKQKLIKGTEASSAAVSVTIKGSDTVLPLAQKRSRRADENKF